MKFIIPFFICGILTSLIFPPYFLLPLGFIIFTFLFYLINLKEFKLLGYFFHFVIGFSFGIGFFLSYLTWIKEPFLLDELTKKYFVFSYLLIIYCSIYFGFIFSIIKFFRSPIIKLTMLPTLIVISEFAINHIGYGFPWFSFALAHSANIFGSYIIFYIGTYGLSFITILIFMFPSIFLIKNIYQKKNLKIFYFIFLIVLLVLILSRSLEARKNIGEIINISISQLNFDIKQTIDKEKSNLKHNLILNTIEKDNSDILIFSENNYPYIIQNDNINILQKFLGNNNNVVIGGTRKENNKYFNSFYLINNKEIKSFDKKILVPFGEFIPLRNLFSFMDFIAGSVDYTVGNNARKLDLNDKISIIPIICYEIIYFWKLIDKTNLKSNLIINITNDSWFGKFSGPYQHFYFSKLRASEFNKNLIRVSNNGISAAINNFGAIIEYTKLNESDLKNFDIRIANYAKNNIKIHKIFLFMIFIFLLIGLISNKKYDT